MTISLPVQRGQYAVVLLLLLVGFFLRSYNIDSMEAFLDEGFHAYRADYLWQLQENPGQNSDGKFLLYYYLGLFVQQHATALWITRIAVAVFSLITAACIYLIGRMLLDHRAGVLSLILYTLLPLASFYERMALADPFAAAFAGLLVWRSLIFARRPNWGEAVLLGVLMAATTMAKLTNVLIPLMPLVTSLLYGHFAETGWFTRWRSRYLRYLTLAWIIGLTLWLPILIPSYFAAVAGTPFLLIDTQNVIANSGTPLDYTVTLIRQSLDVTHVLFLGLALVSTIGLLIFSRTIAQGTFLLFWITFCLLPLISFASQPTPRYIINAMAPLCLMIGLFMSYALERRRVVGLGLVGVGAVWMFGYAVPFNMQMITDVEGLTLDETNRWFVDGPVSTNESIRATGVILSQIPNLERYYADWTICRLLFFYAEVPVVCLDRVDVADQMNQILAAQPAQDDVIVVTGPWPFAAERIQGACVSRAAFFPSINNGVTTWRLDPLPCDSG